MSFHVKLHKMERVMSKFLKEHTAYRDLFRYTRENYSSCVQLSSYIFIYLALPTRAGSPQQHMPITVGPFYLTHPVNFPCGRKPEYPGKTHDFRQSVDFYSFHMRTGFESHREST